jgi:hypothetical protein
MNSKNMELGLRAIGCEGWKWMSGMNAVIPPHDDVCGYSYRLTETSRVNFGKAYPDLEDPATLGCLLSLVRKAWGPVVFVFPDTGWYVQRAKLPNGGGGISLGICANSEAEALVMALEAANGN